MYRIQHREDSYDAVPPTGELQVQAIQPHAHYDATPCRANAPLRLKATSTRHLTSVPLHAVSVDWLHVVSSCIRTLDASFGRHRYLTPLAPSRYSQVFEYVSEDLESAYKVSREVIGTQHKRAETRYNDHVVERLLKHNVFVRVLQHVRNYGALSNWYRTTLVFAKCWQSEAQSSRFGSLAHTASLRRTMTPFASRHSFHTAFLLQRLFYRTQMIVRRNLHKKLITERRNLRRL